MYLFSQYLSLFRRNLITPKPANTKHLYKICTMLDQHRRYWAGVVQMLYKCVVFAGIAIISITSYINNIDTNKTLHADSLQYYYYL